MGGRRYSRLAEVAAYGCFLLAHSKSELMQWRGVRRLSVRPSVCKLLRKSLLLLTLMVGSPPNLHTMDSRPACIQGVLKVKVKVKGHVIRALSWILGVTYSVIDGLVCYVSSYKSLGFYVTFVEFVDLEV